MIRLSSNVCVTLRHMYRRFYAPGYAYARYSPHSFEFSRPQSGKSYENVICPSCGVTVTCIVRDIRGTIRIRRLYGAIALLALLGMVAVFLFGISWAIGQPTALPALALVALCAVLALVLLRTGILAVAYPGVNVKGLFMLPKRHEVDG